MKCRKSRSKHAPHALPVDSGVPDISLHPLKMEIIPVGSFCNAKMIFRTGCDKNLIMLYERVARARETLLAGLHPQCECLIGLLFPASV